MQMHRTLQLSRDELSYVIKTLNVETILGLDPDPLGTLPLEGTDLALIVAERSLRARNMTQIADDNAIQLHTDLLDLIGTCAHAQSVLVIVHWPDPGSTPRRIFVHRRGNVDVVHTRPDDILHHFEAFGSGPQLVSHILALCHIDQKPSEAEYEISVRQEDFDQAYELVSNGEINKAVDLLLAQDLTGESVEMLVKTLDNSSGITLIQSVKSNDNGDVHQKDTMIMVGNELTWSASLPTGPNVEQPVLIETVDNDSLAKLITDWL